MIRLKSHLSQKPLIPFLNFEKIIFTFYLINLYLVNYDKILPFLTPHLHKPNKLAFVILLQSTNILLDHRNEKTPTFLFQPFHYIKSGKTKKSKMNNLRLNDRKLNE